MKPAIRHYGTPLSMGQIRRVAQTVALEVRASLFEISDPEVAERLPLSTDPSKRGRGGCV